MRFSHCIQNSRAGVIGVLMLVLAGCNGGGGGSAGGTVTPAPTPAPTPPPVVETPPPAGTVSLSSIQSGSATLATGDPEAPFTSGLPDGIAAVTVNSPLEVHFTLQDTEGRIVTGLQAENLRFAVAKLVPGSPGVFGVAGTGEADQWVSYIYRTRSGSAIVDGVQATYESASDGALTYNAAGYYTYVFNADITNATRPDDSTPLWDATATHRIAIQLDLRDADNNRILFNPHFDFTFSDGSSVAITDPDMTHKVADESACNGCHNQLTAHGGRVEVEYCVMCHNTGSVDVESGSSLDFKVMIHKIHKGRGLGHAYEVNGEDFSDIGFPQDLRNCSKCHNGDNPQTPQGENWNQRPTQQACMACHEDVDFNNHQGIDHIADDDTRDNSRCRACHGGASTNSSIVNVHWNQLEEDSKNYQFNILDFAYDAESRQATVTYSITNPNDGDAAYDLTEGLTACLADVIAEIKSASDCRDLEGAPFSRFRLYLGVLTVPGATAGIDDYSNHDEYVYAWMGADNDDGSYTATLTVPEGGVGAARLLSSGQAQERKVIDVLKYRNALAANTEITSGNAAANGVEWDWSQRVRVPVLNAFQEFPVDGSDLNERRVVVADAKCNNCHGLLGTTTGSNTVANAFHRGERSSVVACPVCHTPNRASSTEMSGEGDTEEPFIPGTSTLMNQNFEFKNMIHGIHGGEQRSTAYMHEADDLSGETHYPGILKDCTACHVGTTYNASAGKLGAAVSREDALEDRHVFSPFAASCMGCHDTAAVREHMSTAGLGGASVGDFTQAQWLAGAVFERCAECHGPGGIKDVRVVHGIE